MKVFLVYQYIPAGKDKVTPIEHVPSIGFTLLPFFINAFLIGVGQGSYVETSIDLDILIFFSQCQKVCT